MQKERAAPNWSYTMKNPKFQKYPEPANSYFRNSSIPQMNKTESKVSSNQLDQNLSMSYMQASHKREDSSSSNPFEKQESKRVEGP